jgi:hypothetical protein
MRNKKIISTLIVTSLFGGAFGSLTGGAVSKLLFAGGIGKESGRSGGDGSDKLGNDNFQGGTVSKAFVAGGIGKESGRHDGGDGQPKFGGTVSSLYSGGCTNGGGVG